MKGLRHNFKEFVDQKMRQDQFLQTIIPQSEFVLLLSLVSENEFNQLQLHVIFLSSPSTTSALSQARASRACNDALWV